MNIGMQELLVISVLALIVLGPEQLPAAIRNMALWSSRMRRSFNDLKSAVEREIDVDDIRQQIHNETVLHELGETRDALEAFGKQAGDAVNRISGDVADSADADTRSGPNSAPADSPKSPSNK